MTYFVLHRNLIVLSSSVKLLGKTVVLLVIVFMSACSMQPSLPGSSIETGRQTVVEKISIRAELKRALSSWQAGELDQANSHFEAVLDKGPRSSLTLIHYAIFLREQWDIDRAEAMYLQALELAPRDPIAHYNLAILYELYLGDLTKAVKHFKSYRKNVVEANPKVDGWIADLTRRIEAEKNG